MTCEICDTVEAKHTIQGWNVCGSNWCKYVAWQRTPKELPGQGARVETGTKPVTPAGTNDETMIDE